MGQGNDLASYQKQLSSTIIVDVLVDAGACGGNYASES